MLSPERGAWCRMGGSLEVEVRVDNRGVELEKILLGTIAVGLKTERLGI